MVCVALAAICLVVAILAGYLRTTVLDSDQFANRATSALREEAVRDLIGRQITNQVVRASPDLAAVRPLIETAAGTIVTTPAFTSLFHKAVRDLHRTVFTHNRDTATLTLLDVGVLLAGALERLDPQIAQELPGDFAATLNAGETALDALRLSDLADGLEELAWLFGVFTVVLLAAAIGIAPNRRRAVVHAGMGVAVSGALIVIAYQIGRSQVTGRFSLPADGAAAGAVWDTFLEDLRTWALVLLGCGTVVAAAAAALLRPVDVRRPLQRAWDVVATTPATPWKRFARAVAFIVAGALIIAERRWMLDVALVLAGVYVLYQGVEEILRMLVEGREREKAAETEQAMSRRRRYAPWIVGGVATVLVVLLIAGLFGSGATTAEADGDVTACNGHEALCDRPLNEVAFAATHNAMSSSEYRNWLFGQQERGLTGQLDDGVRALLIDAHYGQQVGDRVLTDLDGEQREVAERELGPEATAAATRIRDRLLSGGQEPGPMRVWLCHVMCELGAFPIEDGLREIRDFLVTHPHEVLIVIVEDDGPTPKDIAKAVKDSGLEPYVWKRVPAGPSGPWPTLREMIETDQRVLMMAEKQGGDPAVPWYLDGYRYMQETPYTFRSAEEMSCEPNRGGSSGGRLFLLNHWIDTYPIPRTSNARRINGYDFLLERARRCQRERGLFPNILAVDLYRTGDLLRVTDTLNGVGQSP